MSGLTGFFNSIFYNFFVVFISLCAAVGINPIKTVKPAEPGEPTVDLSAPYLYEEESAYFNYYTMLDFDKGEPKNVDRYVEADGFHVGIYKNNTAAINGITESMKILNIPSDVEGYPVVALLDVGGGRGLNNNIEKAVIPDTVEYLCSDLFLGCAGLRSVELGRRIHCIGENIFHGCYRLTWVRLPDSLQGIPADTFEQCLCLNTVEFGKNIQYIGNGAFWSCTNIKSMYLPDGVETIGEAAFNGCYALKDIYIPASVTEIGEGIYHFPKDVRIHGVKGSYAESFASERGIRFSDDYE